MTETRELKHATVYTIINYTDGAKIREHTVTSADELGMLLDDMRNSGHAEWVFDVDAEYKDNE